MLWLPVVIHLPLASTVWEKGLPPCILYHFTSVDAVNCVSWGSRCSSLFLLRYSICLSFLHEILSAVSCKRTDISTLVCLPDCKAKSDHSAFIILIVVNNMTT